MIIREIINILKQDTELTDNVFMNDTDYIGECIVYSYSQLTNNGIIAQSRLEIDCINKNYEQGYIMLEKVQELLLTLGDRKLTENIIEITQNGGGYVYDKNVNLHKFKAIFSIKERGRYK